MTDPRTIHDALIARDLEYSAYSCNSVNLFGDSNSIKAAATAFHRAAQVDDFQRNLRHWRDECGKLHAKLRMAGVAEQSGAGAPETSVRCGAPAAKSGQRYDPTVQPYDEPFKHVDESDPPCTDCDDTGITFQTERRCTCQAGLALTGGQRQEDLT